MTIKICKEKAMKRIFVCGKVFSKLLQLLFFSMIPIGIYWTIIGYNIVVTILFLLFGIVISFIFIPMIRYGDAIGYEMILHDINKKLKLFKWNEDC